MAETKLKSPEPGPLSLGGSAALGEIVVFIDGQSDAKNILEFAGAIAQEHAARLIGVFVQPGPTVSAAETFARGKGVGEVAQTQGSKLEQIESNYRARFENVVRRHGLQSEWRSLLHFSSEVGVHAYYADLVVIGRPEHAAETASPPDLAESLVLSSGRPILLYPPHGTASQIRRVLVAWNATRESVRAAADALPLLARAQAVEVVVANAQRDALHGQEPGADIARHLARHGAHVEVRRLSSEGQDVGRLLLSQAADFRADLIVMGAYGHSQVREWMFGGVTRTVLYGATIPVLMSR